MKVARPKRRLPVKVGHIYLDCQREEDRDRFAAIVEALDRLTIKQHVLTADEALARTLRALPFVAVGPLVTTPIMACCLMPEVDVVHVHDGKAAQAGLLLTLTRSIPFVMNAADSPSPPRNPLRRSILARARFLIEPADGTPETLIEKYRRSADAWASELPKDTNCG